jgi:aminoglycoside phosphotransferase family enzyme
VRAADPSLADKVACLRSLCGPGDEAIETHFAWVFLVGDRAWKLRKPVRRDPMDYGTLEARRVDSLEEVRLNRRLAPGVYERAAPLTVDFDGRLSIDGEGEVVDWLVCMRRLDRTRQLDAVLQADPHAAIDSVAHLLAGFYRRAAPAITDGDAYLRRLRRKLEDNRRALTGMAIPHASELAAAQSVFLQGPGAGPLAERAATGCVVECHGDLRPEHVYLDDPPLVIDCLEFDVDLRILDRAEELCFLELECRRAGHAAAGRRLREQCLAELGDPATPALLDFYRSHRAATRAKLYAWRAGEPDGSDPAHWRDRAAQYVAAALADLRPH